jgi:hypothetical protein
MKTPNFSHPFAAGTLALFALLLAFVSPAVTALRAQDALPEEAERPTPLPRLLRYGALSAGAQLLDFNGSHTKSLTLYGGTLHGGFFLSRNPDSFFNKVLLTGDVGFFAGDNDDERVVASGAYSPPAGLPAYPGATERAVLKRNSKVSSLPIFLTLAYDFQFDEDIDIRIGPSLGATYFHVKNRIDARYDFYDAAGTFFGSEHRDSIGAGDTARRVPFDKSGSQFVFSYGVTVAATYNFSRYVSADLQYRFLGNTALDLGVERNYGTSFAHQLNLGLLIRF